ncbi:MULTISPECIES: undecaprenyldiphospho-muramoylpentapeptide beta-N-acetylglucosaminyltransferase [Halomonas]|uniref:UDP-N-acetylglucosamine--N-acetylmuramyl-(pentapeptide) pyrophosphoryl-undecaprenol N-acetylglucosamine transferase n=1 Tax=Halomonas halophila TaxID=29573 RepID=A0ABQ0TZL4_9GAMM|nr:MULTISPECIES: undecaprenyldiphospho-muramoylpentapeptide beta-N-acetylglucosaminyltransferase [Halomonas]MDR5889527.1 undecaprenyldiphospho-muramoylpentapeptide beta-N-acetylglucosaminyltransferase [Halomonas salina]PSJ21525.1 undecaprenyldiphospho-muramoylpentapeptide beta-N-acetylglucosaminyltransferase [Halomonas sp. ND22Bw]WJY06209.1 undecaprenyldiphospho-muramoylpentapeptide beta-N-acetylglucosaminyltransferase [Halomonas halophila]GEK71707.1 UDP-N-acetylglucosamine--N-acetylmuramyl-(pe
MSRREGRRALIMAGGTGGHVIPALSLARALQARGVEVEWLGSPRGIENRLVPEAGLPLHRIAVSGLRGNGLAGWAMAPWRLIGAVRQAGRVIRTFDPQLVVGLGGFASGPGGLAAWVARRPLVIHEQNAVAGLTNRVLARLARGVYAAFPQAFPGRAEVVGNPVRSDIAAIGETPRDAETMRARPLRLLVVGGSLGALALNRGMPEALARLPEAERPEVRHQAGRDKDAATREAYAGQGVAAEVTAFIDDMAEAYDWADLVVCRAGALTVAELAAAAKPALFVPFPHAVDDHQTANAAALVAQGAAALMPQSEMTAATLADRLAALLDPDTLATMAAEARGCAHLDAVERLVAGCMETAFE